MELTKSILDYTKSFDANVKEKKDTIEINKIVAERKTFLSKQKLTYYAKLRIDQGKHTVYYFESLKESSSGMSSPGLTVQTSKYKVGSNGQQESEFEQRANFLGKSYDYDFDFKAIRTTIEKFSKDAGFDFQYQITPKGI